MQTIIGQFNLLTDTVKETNTEYPVYFRVYLKINYIEVTELLNETI
jgi:hypothetical protein